MEKSKKLIDLYLLTLFLLGVAALALRTVACFTDWNSLTMHFDGDVVITIANLLVVAAIVLFATYPLLASKRGKMIASSDTPHSYIPAGILAVALLFTAFARLAERSDASLDGNPLLRTLALIIFILGIMSAAFFFLTVFIEKNENTWKAVFGMALVLFCAVSAAYLYFDKSVHPTNSPVKVLDMMAYLFSAIFFLYETRIALGRAMWRLYVAFGLIAALLTAYSAVPTLIYYAFSGVCISSSLYECALLLTMSVFITARVVVTRRLNSEGACDAARCIETLAAKREIELGGGEVLLAQVHENNNMEEIAAEDFENYTMDLQMPEGNTAAEEEND